MRFKKAIAAAVASCMMVMSAASLVRSVSAISSESVPESTDVMIELVGITDDYASRVPLQVILDNMTYAHDVFKEHLPDESDPEINPADIPENDGESVSENDVMSAPENNDEGALENDPANAPANDDESVPEPDTAIDPENDSVSDIVADDDDTVIVVPETSTIPDPDHRRGDKVEIAEGAEFVWIDGERYSVSDENAAVNLFVEDSGDVYILEKRITIGSGEEFDAGNASYSAEFKIFKNRWTFDGFELYTTNTDGEKTALKANLAEIRENSVLYIITSRLDAERNVYLKLSPTLLQNGKPRDDVNVQVDYLGTNDKDDRILTDGQIVVDLRAFDGDNSLIAEQKGVVITAVNESLRLDAVLDPNGEEPAAIDEAYPAESERYDTADISAIFKTASADAEHTVKINALRAQALAVSLEESDIIKAVSGRYTTLEDVPEDADDIKSALFGDGFVMEIDGGAEVTLFIEPASVPGLGTEDMTAFVIHIRFSIGSGEDDDPVDTEPAPDTPDIPDVTEPNTPDPVTEPDPDPVTDPDSNNQPADETVELYYDGGADRVYFDNISKGTFALEITSSTDSLGGFDAVLTDAVGVSLGGFEVNGGSAAIVLNAERDANDELVYGNVSGTLTITADNAEPLVIELSGKSGCASMTERAIMSTAMKYVPYLAEYSLDRDYPWLSVEYSVIGELPEGLSLDAESGTLSGAPITTGKYSFEIAAELTYKDDENSPTARITREVELMVANNTAKNLYMLTDPDYGFYLPLGESIDGRAYYLSTGETNGKLMVVLKGECSEFYDLWLDGVKLTRKSDDYKRLSGATEITFDEGALGGLVKDEIHTLVFAYKPNSSDNLKLAAQNLVITDDKSAITRVDDAAQSYLNMYTPVNRISDDLDSDYAKALSSVRIYAASGELPAGMKTLVKANTAESKGGIGMDIVIADENGEALRLDKNVTAQMFLPESFGEDVYVYFIENGKYRLVSSTVMDGQVFFTLDGSETVVVSQRAIDPNAKSGGNPATGIALSSAGIVFSGAVLVMILTSKRKEDA